MAERAVVPLERCEDGAALVRLVGVLEQVTVHWASLLAERPHRIERPPELAP